MVHLSPVITIIFAVVLACGQAKDAHAQFSCSDVTEVPQVECETLVSLYSDTGGNLWTNNDSWLVTNTPCSWNGITCSSGMIHSVSLASNNLNGSIPLELGSLSNLSTLYLGFNQLSGGIPPELGNLTNLQILSLLHNQLSGSIPSRLGNLGNLRELYLGWNQLSESIPPELGNLGSLENLSLSVNQLSGSIPSQLSNLGNLQSLGLLSNQLSGTIPSELGSLANLQRFDLAWNQVGGNIPSELGELTKLQYLDVRSNQLRGRIPNSLMNLTSLIDGGSHICGNHLYTNNDELRIFLSSKVNDWGLESCQTPPFGIASPGSNLLLLDENCGDGIVQSDDGEQCDDGNSASGDGCSETCVTEFCGDDVLQPGNNEICDDGNTVDGDYCSSNCQVITGWCGDDLVQNIEACDDGNNFTEAACPYGISSCLRCDATCLNVLSLIGNYCGDGIVDPDPFNEQCDDGNRDIGDGCDNYCMFEDQ